MALTATTTLDIVNQMSTLTYYESSSQIDQISFSNDVITLGSISSFNLSKADTILYYSLFQTWYTALLLAFPLIYKSNNTLWPLCNFQISKTTAGVTHINYAQSSQGSSVYGINYVPIAGSSGFSARSSIMISLQEFFMMQIMLQQYTGQVSLN
jgi:hypothetical protein